MSKLNLFVLRYGKSGPMVPVLGTTQPMYFSNKMEAKRHRDLLGAPVVVSYGPDHKLFKGQ